MRSRITQDTSSKIAPRNSDRACVTVVAHSIELSVANQSARCYGRDQPNVLHFAVFSKLYFLVQIKLKHTMLISFAKDVLWSPTLSPEQKIRKGYVAMRDTNVILDLTIILASRVPGQLFHLCSEHMRSAVYVIVRNMKGSLDRL